jgi:hypothetical protein
VSLAPADLLHAWDRAWAWLGGRRERPAPAFTSAYDEVFDTLDPAELRGDTDPLDDLGLADALFRVDARQSRILGFYSEDGVRLAFERYGFFDLLRDRGFDPVLVGDLSDPDVHRLVIHDGDPANGRLLIELVVWVEGLTLPDGCSGRYLFVNWLQMQDPTASFPPDRTPLPDQDHPGLGLFIEFGYLMQLTARRIGCDGLVNHPTHPHNGVLYGKFCRFVDPLLEGRLRALIRDVGTEDLGRLSTLVEAGRVVDETGTPLDWEPGPQVLPVSQRARAWFESDAYRSELKRVRQTIRLRVLDPPDAASDTTRDPG